MEYGPKSVGDYRVNRNSILELLRSMRNKTYGPGANKAKSDARTQGAANAAVGNYGRLVKPPIMPSRPSPIPRYTPGDAMKNKYSRFLSGPDSADNIASVKRGKMPIDSPAREVLSDKKKLEKFLGIPQQGKF